MREIKFRGKKYDSNEWIYGSLLGIDVIVSSLPDVDEDYIGIDNWYSVEEETVGQFTGLYDKNGVEIYEGDIIYGTIKGLLGNGYQNGVVKYGEYGFVIDLKKQSWEPGIGMVGFCSFEDYEVIGNIHEKGSNND